MIGLCKFDAYLAEFVKKASRLTPKATAKLERLKAEVAGTQQIADVDWLREKLEALS